jgi:glycerol-3-phosphate dehydrogenase
MGVSQDHAPPFDLLVVGGGINGTGVARDAAGRGMRVLLCEKDDLAQATSSASTKLIHGGLRYLEYYDFKLVRHALQEREVLLRNAPHIIWPLRFVLPHHAQLRPRWLIRFGLFLYDHIGGRKRLPSSRGIDLRQHPSGAVLKDRFVRGFEYSDCWVQDARLVVLNARDARAHGADVRTRTECVGLERAEHGWQARLADRRTGTESVVHARAVVNAAGPWVEHVLDLDERSRGAHGVRLVKGSHIVVRKLFDHPYPYIFQNADGRVLFALPFENDFTLLGTTDIEIGDEPDGAAVDEDEITYICEAISEYLRESIRPEDAVWSYTGVRPLYDDAAADASAVTRDYVLHLDVSGPPLLSVFGGKITTYRKLSEQVVNMLEPPLGLHGSRWTVDAPLPGGDIPGADFDAFLVRCRERYGWLPEPLLHFFNDTATTEIYTLLAGRASLANLGEHLGGPLYEAEVEYLVEHEWAETADDILWRRTKKGLHVPDGTTTRLDSWLARREHVAA